MWCHVQSFVRQESKVRPLLVIPTFEGIGADYPGSYNVTPEELFELFGKYGPIRYVSLSLSLPLAPKRNTNALTVRSAKALPATPRELPSSSMKTSWMQSRLATS